MKGSACIWLEIYCILPWKRKRKKHKKKWLVQIPNSYLMDVKCPDSCKITVVFSHAQYLLYIAVRADRKKGQIHTKVLV